MDLPIDVLMDVNPELCLFCGICEFVCPFGAIKIYVNGENVNPVLKTKIFLENAKKVSIDQEVCKRSNLLCERVCVLACPLDILDFSESTPPPYIVNVDLCPACGWCASACSSVMNVEKKFDGAIEIQNEKCPEGCDSCVRHCPVNALYLDDGGKVNALNDFCVFCGACINFCPAEGAINLKITSFNAAPTESKAWKNLFEKLCQFKPYPKAEPPAKKPLMWPKTFKSDDEAKLTIERKVYLRNYTLVLNKDLCKKCQICYLVCPKGAINIKSLSSNSCRGEQ